MKKIQTKEYVLLKDVVIQAGTKLDTAPENRGGKFNIESVVAMGEDSIAHFNISINAIEDMPVDLITEIK